MPAISAHRLQITTAILQPAVRRYESQQALSLACLCVQSPAHDIDSHVQLVCLLRSRKALRQNIIYQNVAELVTRKFSPEPCRTCGIALRQEFSLRPCSGRREPGVHQLIRSEEHTSELQSLMRI